MLKHPLKQLKQFTKVQFKMVLSHNTNDITIADAYSRDAIRYQISQQYLKGQGIEIGALNSPLKVLSQALVRYVDHIETSVLMQHYPNLNPRDFVGIDIIDNGEELTTFADESQEFIIANHMIKHCQNPIRTLENFLRILKPEGVLYMAVPDKKYTFDKDRPVTSLEHVLQDYSNGPEWSKQSHSEEWSRLVNKTPEEQCHSEIKHLLAI
jgi:SAM-dependent methyltransferase